MFEFHITCTKDIDFLKIDFSENGTPKSIISGPSNSPEIKHTTFSVPKTTPKPNRSNEDDFYNRFDYRKSNDTAKFEKVEKPEIKDIEDRPVRVASELQNLDF